MPRRLIEPTSDLIGAAGPFARPFSIGIVHKDLLPRAQVEFFDNVWPWILFGLWLFDATWFVSQALVLRIAVVKHIGAALQR